jgi:hypothetical protein
MLVTAACGLTAAFMLTTPLASIVCMTSIVIELVMMRKLLRSLVYFHLLVFVWIAALVVARIDPGRAVEWFFG